MILQFLWQLPKKIMKRLLLLFPIFFVIFSDTTTEMCDGCLNNSTCRLTILRNVSSTLCICHQGWVGSQCEGRLQLLLVSISMTTLTLRIEVTTPKTQVKSRSSSSAILNYSSVLISLKDEPVQNGVYQITGPNLEDQNQTVPSLNVYDQSKSFKYSIHFWSDDSPGVCNIIVPNHVKNTVFVEGLVNNTQYTFCAKTKNIEVCDLSLLRSHQINVSYCLNVTTKSNENTVVQYLSSIYTIIASSIGGFCLIILLVLMIMCLKTKHSDESFSKTVKRQKKREINLYSTIYPRNERITEMIPLTSTNNRTVAVNPANNHEKPRHLMERQVCIFT